MNLITICGHTFIDKLNSESVVFDLGANRGVFSKGILDKYNCTVIAYEPSRLLCENELSQIDATNEKFSFYQNAVWSTEKTLTLTDFCDKNGGTSGVANSIIPHKSDTRRDGRFVREKYEVRCESINNILKKYEKVDILKVDIEGSEIEVLTAISDDNIRKCTQVCVEFHLFCQNEYMIKITQEDLKRVIDRMHKLGFSSKKTNNKHPDFLFYREW